MISLVACPRVLANVDIKPPSSEVLAGSVSASGVTTDEINAKVEALDEAYDTTTSPVLPADLIKLQNECCKAFCFSLKMSSIVSSYGITFRFGR